MPRAPSVGDRPRCRLMPRPPLGRLWGSSDSAQAVCTSDPFTSYDRSFMLAFYCVWFFFFFHKDRTCGMIFFINIPDFAVFVCSFVLFFGIFWPCSVACRILVL